jgi:hypothetical protein
MAGRLYVPNDRQNIANCIACALRATRMRSTAPAGSGVASRLPRALAAASAALVSSAIAAVRGLQPS